MEYLTQIIIQSLIKLQAKFKFRFGVLVFRVSAYFSVFSVVSISNREHKFFYYNRHPFDGTQMEMN